MHDRPTENYVPGIKVPGMPYAMDKCDKNHDERKRRQLLLYEYK